MTPPKTLRATSPTDLLACVPTLLGFHPEHSLVMVTTGRAGVPVHARVDLPDRTGCDEIVAAVAEDLRRAAVHSGIDAVVLVLYTADVAVADEVGVALTEALGGAGVEVQLVLRADGERWFRHAADGTAQAADAGVAYDLAQHPLTVQAVVEGRVVHRDRGSLRATLDPARPAELAAVAAAVDRHCDRLLGCGDGEPGAGGSGAEESGAEGSGAEGSAATCPEAGRLPDRAAVLRHQTREAWWVRQRVRRFLDDRRALDAEDAGRLLVAIVSVQVRDVAWAQMDRDSARAHVDLWRDLVRRSPVALLAAPAALLAFAAWLSGDGALAWCAVERCQSSEPDYSMAALVTQALAGAMPPSVWEPLDERTLPLLEE